MSEQTYTLSEAQRELALRECARWGHEWEVVSGYTIATQHTPLAIKCGRCGWSGKVEMGDQPRRGHDESPPQTEV